MPQSPATKRTAGKSPKTQMGMDVVLMLSYIVGSAAIVSIFADNFINPRSNTNVYSVPQRIVVDRSTDTDGSERITISTVLRKNTNCSVEGGSGQPRIRYFAPNGNTDIAPLFRPTGELAAGKTQAHSGEKVMVQGYWAPVPANMKDASYFVVEVPCQLGPERNFERVIAKWGPAQMPKENTVIWNGLEPSDTLMGRNYLNNLRPLLSNRNA